MTNTDRLSIQLYTLRTLGDLDHVLDATAAAGFRHVELVGSHLDNAAATKAALDARGLTVSTSHVSLAALRERPRMVIDACHALRFNELFMPSVPQEQRDMDAAGWRAIGTELAELTETMGKAGIKLGYHNHNWEMRKKERRQDGARTDLRGRRDRATEMAGRRRVARARRRRTEGVDARYREPPHRRPRQGHRARRRKRRPGRLGRCRRRACSTGPICGARAQRRRRRSGWSSSTTSPRTPPLRARASFSYISAMKV